MSLYIKGIEVPTTCGKCRIKNAIECDRWKLVRSVVLDRHRDCPLVPVPEPHGDLIDRDELLSQYGGPIWTAKTDYAEGLRDVVADIKCVAAIIGAEPCNDLAKPNNTIFAVQNADEDERLFEAKPIDYMHTPSVEEIIEADGLDSFIKHFED